MDFLKKIILKNSKNIKHYLFSMHVVKPQQVLQLTQPYYLSIYSAGIDWPLARLLRGAQWLSGRVFDLRLRDG